MIHVRVQETRSWFAFNCIIDPLYAMCFLSGVKFFSGIVYR